MKRSIFLLTIVLSLAACNKDKIKPDQADSFIKYFGNAFLDTGSEVKQTPDGGFIVVGTLTKVDEEASRKTALDKDIYLIKTDRYGNKIWDKNFGGILDDIGNSVELTSDGGFIVAGTTFDTTFSGNEVSNCFLVKVSADGTEQWHRSYGGNEKQEGRFVCATSNGDFIIAGSTTALRVSGGGFEENPSGKKDIFILKVNSSGDSLWAEAYGYSGNDVANCIKERADGGLVILGTTDHSEAGQGHNNLILITTNNLGKGPVNKTFGGEGDDYGNSLQVLADGYLITGSYEKNSVSNVYLVKIGFNIFEAPVFEKFYGDATISSGNWVTITQDGMIGICGTAGNTGSRNILFIKTDASGKQLVSQTYGGTGDQWASAIDVTEDGGFIITGSNDFDGNSLITLLKISSTGSL